MKNLQEAYAEVLASEALKAKFAEIKTQQELMTFVRGLGVEAKDEEIIAFLQGKAGAEGELDDEALLQVAGGKSYDPGEAKLSVFTLGLGCAVTAIISKTTGKSGTDLKEGMICGD